VQYRRSAIGCVLQHLHWYLSSEVPKTFVGARRAIAVAALTP
jgi:hypothetical protein